MSSAVRTSHLSNKARQSRVHVKISSGATLKALQTRIGYMLPIRQQSGGINNASSKRDFRRQFQEFVSSSRSFQSIGLLSRKSRVQIPRWHLHSLRYTETRPRVHHSRPSHVLPLSVVICCNNRSHRGTECRSTPMEVVTPHYACVSRALGSK